jgi:hypothetical protein
MDDFQESKILVDPPDKKKMSGVILEFVEPLLENIRRDFELTEKVIAFGILAWNASLLSKKERKATLRELKSLFPLEHEDDHKIIEDNFKMLLARKKKHFSENKRAIVDFQLYKLGKKLKLDVVSAADSE